MGGESRLPYWLLTGLLLCATPLFFISVSGGLLRHVPPELYAFGHVGLFGVVALLLLHTPALKRLAFGRRAVLTLAAVLLVGGALEVVQPLFGRSASLMDLGQNLAGALVAVAALAPAGVTRRSLAAVALAAVTVALYAPTIDLWDRAQARQHFPLLGDFETRFEHRRWSSGTPSTRVAHTGNRSLEVPLRSGHSYPGTTLRRSIGNWHGYSALQFHIYLPEGPPLDLTVSIRDQVHFQRGGRYTDRFNRRYQLEPGWNAIRISVDSIRQAPRNRELELDDLAEVVFFTTRLDQDRVIYLDSVQLEPAAPPGGR